MRILCIFFVFISSLHPLFSIAHDGTINISGKISDNTCTIVPEDLNMTVDFGDVPVKQLNTIEGGSRYEQFMIRLENCAAAAKNVSILFTGTADIVDSNYLAIQTGSEYATGVSIGIYDKEKTLIPLNTEGPVTSIDSERPITVNLQFYAKLIPTGASITPGPVKSYATFVLEYS